MSLSEDIERNRIAALLQAIYATKYIKEDKFPCQIEEGLFMGSVGAALSKDTLKSLNITHVLIVAKSLSPAFPNDFIYRKIDVLDTADTNLSEHFDECFDFINEAKRIGGNVLVHCFAGISRSGTIVVAYLMKQRGMDLCHALEFVRSKRPQVQPHHGFMIQLQEFEKSLRDACLIASTSVGGVSLAKENVCILSSHFGRAFFTKLQKNLVVEDEGRDC